MHHLSHIESILLAVIIFSWHYWFNFFQGPRNLAIHPWSLLLALQMFVPRNPKSLGSGSSESLMWAARKFGSNWAEAAPGGVWRAPPTSAGRDPVVSNPIWYLDHHLFWGMSNRVLCNYVHDTYIGLMSLVSLDLNTAFLWYLSVKLVLGLFQVFCNSGWHLILLITTHYVF